MHLFTRTVHTAGPPAEVMTYATEMRDYVSDAIGRDVALWTALFGAPVGAFSYAMRVDGIADLRAATDHLRMDETYLAKVASGAHLMSAPAEDWIGTPVHGDMGTQSPPVGSYAAITRAQISNGRYGDAFGWAIEIAEHVSNVTGIGATVCASDYGPFGTITWIGVTSDAAAVDNANRALMGDDDYIKMLGSAGDLFVEGSGSRVLATRVA